MDQVQDLSGNVTINSAFPDTISRTLVYEGGPFGLGFPVKLSFSKGRYVGHAYAMIANRTRIQKGLRGLIRSYLHASPGFSVSRLRYLARTGRGAQCLVKIWKCLNYSDNCRYFCIDYYPVKATKSEKVLRAVRYSIIIGEPPPTGMLNVTESIPLPNKKGFILIGDKPSRTLK